MDGFDEWEIINFGCWRSDMHGEVIECKYLYTKALWNELYPRGFGGMGEYLEVRTLNVCFPRDGEISFIGSDGSVICTRSSTDSDEKWICFTGPKYEEVVAGIKKNEPVYKDRLILRWKTQHRYVPQRFSTVIEISSQFFQIKPDLFNTYDSREIFTTFSDIGNSVYQKISVKANKTGGKLEDTNVTFTLTAAPESQFLLRTSIWMDNVANINQKCEDNCMLDKSEQQIFSPGIPLKELFEEGFLTIMCFKVISGSFKYNHCYSNHMLPPYIEITESSRLSVRNMLEREGTVASTPKQESQPENAVTVLLNDLMCLYQDQALTDLELRCDTVSFPTHRAILSARSPVFKAMLSGDMREAACGEVDVEDLDPHTLGRFLSYLYSGSTGEEALQWEEASKLYYAADKYQVPSLMKECSAVLHASVSLGNVCDILSLADKHQDEELRSVAHDFILENYNEVLGSENWEKLMKCDPVLVAETVTSFVKNKCVKKVIRS